MLVFALEHFVVVVVVGLSKVGIMSFSYSNSCIIGGGGGANSKANITE